MVNLSVDYGLHSVKLDSLIQFECPPWEFKLLCHSFLQHEHYIVLLILCVNIQCGYSFCIPFSPFSWIIVINLLMRLFLVPRSLCKFNMVSELTEGWSSISQKKAFWQISTWKLSNSSKIQHCTRSQGLPLNTPSKELVDQACFIDYAGCDESLKFASCPTLHFPFCCDF